MSYNVNVVILRGNWTKDPELRYTENGRPFALCTLAVDRPASQNGEEKVADFIPVIVGGELAETVAEQTRKGSTVWVVGALRVRTYQDANGHKRTSMNVNAYQVGLILTSGKKKAAQNGASQPAASNMNSAAAGGAWQKAQTQAPAAPEPAKYYGIDDLLTDEGDLSEDDLPF